MIEEEEYNPKNADKYAISADRWDWRISSQAIETSPELNATQRRLQKDHATGPELIRDIFHSFVKVQPNMKEAKEVAPTHRVNRAITNEIMKLEDFDVMRKMSVGDRDGASIATSALEKDIEVIFDKMKKAQEMAEELAKKMAERAEAMEDPTAEEMIENLNKEISDLEKELDKEIEGNQEMMSEQLMGSMGDLADQAEGEEIAKGWGLDKGQLAKMPSKTRLELGKKLSSEHFKRMAEVIGRFESIAMSVVEQKKVESQEEIYDVELGNDIEKILPGEVALLTDDDLFFDFVRKFTERNLTQYALQGTETTSKGGICFIEDGSGSMHGEPEIWAKAIGLALLKIASVQHREFNVIHFGAAHQHMYFKFDTSGDTLKLDLDGTHYSGFDAVLAYAETQFSYGGPLRWDQRVATPNGWKLISELTTDDSAIGVDGRPTKIVGVYPQGELKNVYKLTFKDDSTVICDDEHLWTVYDRPDSDRNLSEDKLITLPLKSILELGLVSEQPYGSYKRFSVPVAEPLELPEKKFSVSPYLMGYLLGDGTLGGGRSVSIHSSEDEHPWREELPEGITVGSTTEPSAERCGTYGLKGKGRGNRSVNILIEELKRLSLLGVREEHKFVPDEYLWSSKSQRHALLQGLLDSDGTLMGKNTLNFSNTSKDLCDAVAFLMRSLGGNARVSDCKVRDNEKPLWLVTGFISPELEAPFRLTRKAERYSPREKKCSRTIVSAERVDAAECVCIKVENSDGLFLTEALTVTHNTDFATPFDKAIEFFREENDATGATKADIIFATDGQAYVTDEWLAHYHGEKEDLAFKAYGFIIGGYVESEPINSICDVVATPAQLLDGTDLEQLFKAL